ncbi:MAG: sterol desaturase family protein [Bacteroidetes bacterium]|nr:sterol desaturase family protein [Bacteroidota bacterium]
MKKGKIQQGKGRVFDNPVLELLTRSSPWIIWSIYLPVISFSLYWAYREYQMPVGLIAAVFFGAIFFWTFAEYILHRYVFHFVNENKWVQKFHYLAHGYHHEYPKDSDHLFMPPLPSIVLAVFFFSLFYFPLLPFGLERYAFAFFPGFVLGYLAYATMHYSMHVIRQPIKPLRNLWRHHHLHHYKADGTAYGVSTTIWDHVFRTLPSKGPKVQEPRS